MASNVPGGNAKSDTSRRQPVIKNPLLSSQLTGLTLDDFAPVAVLSPAAPLPSIAKDPTESTGHTKAAIFSAQIAGSGTVPQLPQDTDSFSEIDLNATSESHTPSRPQPVEYNPLQDLEESDGRGPGLDGAGNPSTSVSPSSSSYLQQTSALTAQFAAQLPNVASTVFSTFSRVIKGSSPAPPANEQPPSAYGGAYDSQHELHSTAPPYGGPPPPPLAAASLSSAPLINSYACEPSPSIAELQAQSAAAVKLPPPPPPTFYNPEQVASSAAPLAAAPPPTSTVALSNTYRLGGSKKKTYAHIPGLSTTSHPGGGVVHPSAPVAPQNVSVVPLTPLAPIPLSYPGDAQTVPAGSVFPIPADSSSVFPVAQAEVSRPEPSLTAGSKGKPSLFGYIPTKILEKLPKPSFGGEKGEVSQFKENVASIVDQFVAPILDTAPAPQGIASHGPPAAVYYAPPFAGGPPPTASQPQPASNLFATSVPATSEGGNRVQPIAADIVESTPQPPPTFYSPARIPTVPVAPPSASASKTNPYSSARRAPGVGPYKNPLAPTIATPAGPVYLPTQLPPSVAQSQQLKAPPSGVILTSAPKDCAATPSSVLTPAGLVPTVQQTPGSIFNPANASSGTPILTAGKLEESAPFNINLKLEESATSTAAVSQSSTATLVPTFSGPFTAAGSNVQPFPPASIFDPLASVQSNQESKQPLPYPPESSLDSIFPSVIPAGLQQAATTFVEQNPVAVFTKTASSDLQQHTPAPADNPWQAQYNSFNNGSSSFIQTNATATPALQELPDSQDSATPNGFTQYRSTDIVTVGAKPIVVDSRSRSSENVLSPPPRPDSNLSEPAGIIPGFVPPAGIFRSDTDALATTTVAFSGSGSLRNQPEQRKPQETHTRPSRQGSNANNNPSNFFADSLTTSALPAENQLDESQRYGNVNAQAVQKPISLPQQTSAINPNDFFNSNSTALPQEPAAESTIKTGQTISSVPLFSFFGRAADPVPTVGIVPEGLRGAAEQQEPNDQADGVRDPQATVNDRFGFGGANDDDDGEQEDGYFARIVNASNEPIFSSDNLFDFKSSAYQDGGFYSSNAGHELDVHDGNSSMAALATTSVGAPDTTANTAGTSVTGSSTNIAYRPTYNHWFYKREVDGKSMWLPFTMADSMALEDGLTLAGVRTTREHDEESPPPVIVHTDGGRYDVSIRERQRTPVYWHGPSNEVRRCSWFYKNVDSRFVPYDEDVAELLEREYKEASTSGEWHRRIQIPNGETVVFHGPSVIVHFLQTQNPDSWGGGSSPVPSTTNRPRVVKRGIDEFNIDDDEPEKIDHLLFMVHGIGEACDLRFRSVVEVVDEFRSLSAQLVQSHYRSSFDRGDVGRVEILPISWHDDLHSLESGVDEKLKSITLPSIPKLRHFTNDTLLDVLFYTSPMFCQSIVDAVGNSLNRLFTLFCERNPSFNGRVSLAGHSLGSLILFDLLCHQKKSDPKQPPEPENSENPDGDSVPPIPHHYGNVRHRPLTRKCSQQINYEVGKAGTGQPFISYTQLLFEPKMFFALGSPIGMFVTIRGIDALGLDFKLPTCDGFFNIFHPYDPVAYRIEALINPDMSSLPPVLIPHHKGRKRMHLELKETMVRVSNDLKHRVSDMFRNTLGAVWALTAINSRADPKTIQSEVDKVLEDQLKFETSASSSNLGGGSDVDSGETTLPLGQLNQGRRVDYVLQEAPFEFINEYLFALTSHVCYWDSEDTMLFVMKEIYSSFGVQADIQVPQQSMTIERPLPETSPSASNCSLNSNYNLLPPSSNR